MEMKFLLVIIVFCSVLASALSQNDTTTTTDAPTTTTLTTSTNATTTTAEPETNTTTTTASPATTTNTPETTTTSHAPLPPPKAPILSYRIPNNESVPACLKVNMSVEFEITYDTEFNRNASLKFNLNNYTSYSGICGNESFNSLTIEFENKWSLLFNYTLVSKAYYTLNTVNLTYMVTTEQFPNASNSSLGIRNAFATNLTEFKANKGNSFKCYSETDIKLNDLVSVDVSNYLAQPFLTDKNQDLDTAVECDADTTGTSKLVPIIVGSALAVLVILVLVAYIIGRRKHRPGYQQV